jgi:hypothetical protein
MLGVTALAEQVTKLTEWANSHSGPAPSGATPTGKTGNAILDFIGPMLQGVDLNEMIKGFTGGGAKAGNPFADVDKELVESVMKEARERAVMEKEALRAMRDEIIAGKKIFRNAETGDIIIANPTAGKTKESS